MKLSRRTALAVAVKTGHLGANKVFVERDS